jgi:hypothetical protein
MERDHQQIWAGLGGGILFVGAAGMIAIAVVPAQAPTAHLWHQDWFLSLVALCGVCMLAGAYVVVAALFRDWPLPQFRSTEPGGGFRPPIPQGSGSEAHIASLPSAQRHATEIVAEDTPKRRRLSALARAAAGVGKPPDEIAIPAAREAIDLIEKGKQLEEEAWTIWRRVRRSGIPIHMLPKEFHERVNSWNADVLALADKVLTTKEAAQVAVYPMSSFRSFSTAQHVADVIQSNTATLRVIRDRCQG